MAERLLKDALPGSTVTSAGLSAMVDDPADPHAQDIMMRLGKDIGAHRARQINADMVHRNELILVMTQRQKADLEKHYPEARGRVFLLGHWQKADVPDPYQQPRQAFDEAYALIEAGVQAWAEKLH